MPRRRQRPGLGLAVADHAGDDQVGVVERRAESVAERVTELAAFVDAARRFGRHMAGNAAGEAELLEELEQAVLVLGDLVVNLGVGAFEVDVGKHRRSAVAGAGDVDHVEVVLLNDPVEVGVDEGLPRRRSPVAQ